MLHMSLVSDADYLQETSYIVSTNNAITVHPRARAKIEVGWRSEEMEIAVQDNLMFDALIGADYPDIWELGKQLVYKELINLAQTRNARKINYKEINSDVSDTLEDDMKEAGTQEDQEPDVYWSDNEIKKGEDDNGPSAAKHSESQKQQEDAPCINQPELHIVAEDKDVFKKVQKQDATLQKALEKAEQGDDKYILEDGLLWRQTTDRLGDESRQLCVPQQYQSLVRSLAHRPGHLGRDKTLARILDEYYWPGVSSDVQQLCTACPECQKGSKARPRKAPLQSLPVISEPFSRIGMDLVGPLPRTKLNNRYILVVMNYSTRWPEAFLLSTTESRAIADELLVLFIRVSVPKEIVTDCGANFLSRLMREL